MTALATPPIAKNPGPVFGTPGAPKMEREVIQRWFSDKGDQTLRITYPLHADSIVFDVGGYEGNWAGMMDERYGCEIHIFEPVPQFAETIARRFAGRGNIRIHQVGMADETVAHTIFIDRDSTSVHKAKGTPCTIQLKSARHIFDELSLSRRGIDLMKINIEGCEFELLQHLIDTGLVHKIRDLQVQFHDFVPDAPARMEDIQRQLAKSHDLTWAYRFVWENWRRR